MNNLKHTGIHLKQESDLQIIRYCGISLIIISVLLDLNLAYNMKIHWDEFHYLSFVYSYLEGRSLYSLQTFHVHFFSWLPLISENEVRQIIAARIFISMISIGSGIMIYKIGRIYLSKEGALFSSLCYFSYYNIILHGSSFRMDPICTLLFLSSLYIILAKPHSYGGAITAGLLMALSLMVTIKSSIHLSAIFIIYLSGMIAAQDRPVIRKHAIIFGTSLLIGSVLLYNFHISSLSFTGTATAYSGSQAQAISHTPRVISLSSSYLKIMFEKMFMGNGILPRLTVLQESVCNSLIIWLCLLGGVILTVCELFQKNKDARRIIQLIPLLILPLTLIFYRNAWPYYYVFIMPPLFIYCGKVIDKAIVFIKGTGYSFMFGLVFLLFVTVFISMATVYAKNSSDNQGPQKRLINLVHRIFPEPTPYIDACNMISSYPKVGFYMSTLGVEKYREKNTPIYRDLITTYHPVFLIADRACINPEKMTDTRSESTYRLLDEDIEVITNNYIKHWGKIYVAGKTLDFSEGSEPREFEMLIPGTYTVEAEDTINIDGIDYSPGMNITLESGKHRMSANARPMTVVLRWGENLYRPGTGTSSDPDASAS